MNSKTLYFVNLFCSILFFCFSCQHKDQEKHTSNALTSDQQAVKITIEQLFQALYDGDSTKAKMAFVDSARLYTIFATNDSTVIKEGKLQQFIHAIGSPHDFQWIEKSWDYKISIDGVFAQAWCSYAFFAGERFSHCGVDAFHLVKQNHRWRIFSLADTRRKDDCLFPKGDFSEPKASSK